MKIFFYGFVATLVIYAAGVFLWVVLHKYSSVPRPDEQGGEIHYSFLSTGSSVDGLFIEGDSDLDPIRRLYLGKYCSTVNLETLKVVNNWSLCKKQEARAR